MDLGWPLGIGLSSSARQRQREWSAAGVKSYSSTFTKYYGLKIRSKLLPEKKQDVEFCHDAALLLITVYGWADGQMYPALRRS